MWKLIGWMSGWASWEGLDQGCKKYNSDPSFKKYILLTHFMQNVCYSDQNYLINHTHKFESEDTFFPVNIAEQAQTKFP